MDKIGFCRKEWRLKRFQEKKCQSCGKANESWPDIDCSLCKKKRKDKRNKEHRRDYAIEIREQREAKGVCRRCGKVKVERFKNCIRCREREKNYRLRT